MPSSRACSLCLVYSVKQGSGFIHRFLVLTFRFTVIDNTSTSLGVITMLYWPVALALIIVALLIAFVFRYASVASLAVAILAPIIFLGLGLFAQHPLSHAFYGLLAGTIVVLALRRNIVHLLAGTERRLSY